MFQPQKKKKTHCKSLIYLVLDTVLFPILANKQKRKKKKRE